jgi:hypothetical protein
VLVPARALAVSRLFRLLIFDYFLKGLNKVRDTRTGSGALFVSLPMHSMHSARLASYRKLARQSGGNLPRSSGRRRSPVKRHYNS